MLSVLRFYILLITPYTVFKYHYYKGDLSQSSFWNFSTKKMEDLQSLMSCLDEISNVIGDGMYLSMANKLKRIHNKLNGNKPFHEDSFYYSSDSDDDYETDSEQVTDNRSPEAARREVRIQIIRDHLLD